MAGLTTDAGILQQFASGDDVSFIGVGTPQEHSSGVNTTSPPLHASTAEGDFLVAFVEGASTATISPPGGGGWTTVVDNIGTVHKFSVYVKAAGAGEGTPDFTYSSSNQGVSFVVTFRNVDISNVAGGSWEGATTITATATSTTASCASITTAADGNMAIMAYGVNSPQSWGSDDTGYPSGASETGIVNRDDNSDGCAAGAAYLAKPTAGSSSGPHVFGYGGSSDQSSKVTLDLQKA